MRRWVFVRSLFNYSPVSSPQPEKGVQTDGANGLGGHPSARVTLPTSSTIVCTDRRRSATSRGLSHNILHFETDGPGLVLNEGYRDGRLGCSAASFTCHRVGHLDIPR